MQMCHVDLGHLREENRGFHPCRSFLSSWPHTHVAADQTQRQQQPGSPALLSGRGDSVPAVVTGVLRKMLKAVGVPVQEG